MSLIHLFDAWPEISAIIQAADTLFVGTDYDGTLAPLTDDPAEETLPDTTRQLLFDLLRIPGLRVAVISGRDIPNLRQRVRVPFLAFAGNHGLELEWCDQRDKHPDSEQFRATVQRLTSELTAQTATMPGLFIQDKGLSLTAHFQRAAQHRDELKRLIEAHLRPEENFKIRGSHTAWDVRPDTTWTKGTAFQMLREAHGCVTSLGFFLGDDRSDEDAFAALSEQDLGVLVGPERPTLARYRLNDYHEVAELFRRVIALRQA